MNERGREILVLAQRSFFSRIFKLAAVQFAPICPDSKLTMAQAVTKILPKCSNHLILSSTILNLHPIVDCQAYCMTNLIVLKKTKHLPRVLGFKSGISNSLNSQNIYTKSGGAAAPGNLSSKNSSFRSLCS